MTKGIPGGDVVAAQGGSVGYDEFVVDQADWDRRKAYLELTSADAELLRALLPEASASTPRYLDRFYQQMERFSPTADVLARSSMDRDALRRLHGEQLLIMLGGQYDAAYANARSRVGIAHQKIGLQPEWYVGAYRHMLAEMLPLAWRQCEGDQQRFLATVDALFKIILLDIELAISAYFHADHQKLRLFAKVFESDLEAVIITDTRGSVIHASHMTESISGYAPKELQGRPLSLLHSPKNNLDFDDVWQEVTLDGAWQGNVWHRHANGSDYLARVSIASVKNDEGMPTHYVMEYSDVTESWEAEQSLRARTDELARSNRELEQFAYVASHDLQEPLRMVASYTQLLARRYKDKLDDDANEFINFAVDGATRMQVLINDLLKLSRVGTRGKPFEMVEGDKVLDAALANLNIAISEAKAEIVRDPLPTIFADDTQLIQLLQNLIGNAIKFRQPGAVPTIRVNATRMGRAWQLSVVDNGIGIAPEYFERIFVIFQRLHAKTEYPGTGIGLALCKKIVERHGGRIWVESKPGEGTAFHFTIPDREE